MNLTNADLDSDGELGSEDNDTLPTEDMTSNSVTWKELLSV